MFFDESIDPGINSFANLIFQAIFLLGSLEVIVLLYIHQDNAWSYWDIGWDHSPNIHHKQPGFGHDVRSRHSPWIGFVGKIFTGNHGYFPIKYGAFRFQFSLKPIHWYSLPRLISEHPTVRPSNWVLFFWNHLPISCTWCDWWKLATQKCQHWDPKTELYYVYAKLAIIIIFLAATIPKLGIELTKINMYAFTATKGWKKEALTK